MSQRDWMNSEAAQQEAVRMWRAGFSFGDICHAMGYVGATQSLTSAHIAEWAMRHSIPALAGEAADAAIQRMMARSVGVQRMVARLGNGWTMRDVRARLAVLAKGNKVYGEYTAEPDGNADVLPYMTRAAAKRAAKFYAANGGYARVGDPDDAIYESLRVRTKAKGRHLRALPPSILPRSMGGASALAALAA